MQQQFDRYDLLKLQQIKKLEYPWSGALITFKVILHKNVDQREFIVQWNEQFPEGTVERHPDTQQGIYGCEEGIYGQTMCYIFETIFSTKVEYKGEYEPDSLCGSVYVPHWIFNKLTIPSDFSSVISEIDPKESLGIYW